MTALKWNKEYQEDLKLYNSIDEFHPELGLRRKRREIMERMKVFGLWPIGNIKVPVIKIIRQHLALGKKGEVATLRLKRDNRFLAVEIDITADKDTIFDELWEAIDFVRQARATALTSPELDPLAVYEMVNDPVNGKTIYQLAQLQCGTKAAPTYDDEVKRCDAKLRYAYKKAQGFIAGLYSRQPRPS